MYLALINNQKVAYLMVMLLVLASGSPFFKAYGIYFPIIMSFVLFVDLIRFPQLRYEYQDALKYVSLMLMIFFCQYVVLGWNTVPGIINFICKIFWGSFIIITLGEKFKFYYLKVLYHLSFIGLILFLLQTVFGITFSLFDFGSGKSIILYYVHHRDIWRNCGPFWEPGAYGCYLLFVPLIFINNLSLLYHTYRKECIILFLALLTTQSTTAYLSLGMFIILILVFQIRSVVKKSICLVGILVLFMYVYNTSAFLNEKISEQTKTTIQDKGKFNATRLGTLVFDWHYIKKHPFCGNGFHNTTRYADHPHLVKAWEKGEKPLSGNGFSDFLAKMGVSYFIIFFYTLYKTNRNLGLTNFFVVITIFIMLLCGEPLLNYPIALSFPFVVINSQT